MKQNSKLILVTTTLIVLGLLVGYQVFYNTPSMSKSSSLVGGTGSQSICWNSLTQTCGGTCTVHTDCGSGYICINKKCPTSFR